ncbi:hypothetical protein ARMSODRAFT_956604 [Armillaria solidipes]|uniref:Uncharacterized protein n=1 Tax=Armillaria solidipes TaxID=1076256 RepID=A0A2H3C0Y1_9AGAR|nr:hypothetical protein ARMSODRAFT_956604 [Armillaria solidipes]
MLTPDKVLAFLLKAGQSLVGAFLVFFATSTDINFPSTCSSAHGRQRVFNSTDLLQLRDACGASLEMFHPEI